MKVLMVSHNFLPAHTAGTEIYTAQLARRLLDLGLEVRVFTSDKDIGRPEPLDHRARPRGSARLRGGQQPALRGLPADVGPPAHRGDLRRAARPRALRPRALPAPALPLDRLCRRGSPSRAPGGLHAARLLAAVSALRTAHPRRPVDLSHDRGGALRHLPGVVQVPADRARARRRARDRGPAADDGSGPLGGREGCARPARPRRFGRGVREQHTGELHRTE